MTLKVKESPGDRLILIINSANLLQIKLNDFCIQKIHKAPHSNFRKNVFGNY